VVSLDQNGLQDVPQKLQSNVLKGVSGSMEELGNMKRFRDLVNTDD